MDIQAIRSLSSDIKSTIRDLLIIDDITGYTNNAGTFVAGYEPARLLPGDNTEAVGVSQATQILVEAGTDYYSISQQLLGQLDSGQQTTYQTIRDAHLIQPREAGDLPSALQAVESLSGFSDDVKRIISDLLIINDIIGYTNSAGVFVYGYEPAYLLPGDGNPGAIGVSQATQVLVEAGTDYYSISQQLLPNLTTPNDEAYFYLRDRLTLPESEVDLYSDLCLLSPEEGFCPNISAVAVKTIDEAGTVSADVVAEVRQGQTVEITLTGIFPENPVIQFVLPSQTPSDLITTFPIGQNNYAADPDIAAITDYAQDQTAGTLTFRFTVPAGYPIVDGQVLPQVSLLVISHDNLFFSGIENVFTINNAAVVAPTNTSCTDEIDNNANGLTDMEDPAAASARKIRLKSLIIPKIPTGAGSSGTSASGEL